ncbi:MAG: RNA methyltransferase, partial [Ruminococcaceae bacterium]|nr:RNA methyltransferase [Oscillospiraceae bacterium]
MENVIEIAEFSAPELDVYARLTEAQLMHCSEPALGMFIAESPKVIERALEAGHIPVSMLSERKHIEGQASDIIARCREITPDMPVFTADTDILAQLTGYKLTRGVLCAMRRLPLPQVRDICADARRIAVLENVMNPANLGSVFRSAAALGMDAVLLTPGCTDP